MKGLSLLFELAVVFMDETGTFSLPRNISREKSDSSRASTHILVVSGILRSFPLLIESFEFPPE